MYIGKVLYGYCDGYFGDSYGDKRIEAIGADWIVARKRVDGEVCFASFDKEDNMKKLIKEWSKPKDEDENDY